jgi:hypothetical protein
MRYMAGESDKFDVYRDKRGEHLGVDLVGLGCEWGEALDLDRVGHLDVPAPALELIVDEASAVHRLDHTGDRLAVPGHERCECPQSIGVRSDRGHLDRGAVLIHDVYIEPLAR